MDALVPSDCGGCGTRDDVSLDEWMDFIYLLLLLYYVLYNWRIKFDVDGQEDLKNRTEKGEECVVWVFLFQ